jgi:hypothetical protein
MKEEKYVLKGKLKKKKTTSKTYAGMGQDKMMYAF